MSADGIEVSIKIDSGGMKEKKTRNYDDKIGAKNGVKNIRHS